MNIEIKKINCIQMSEKSDNSTKITIKTFYNLVVDTAKTMC